MNSRPLLREFNSAALWAGLTAFLWYVFGAVPLLIAVSQQLTLSTAETSSWLFITYFSGAVATIVLSFHFRQPIPIAWTIPGLVYLGTLADRFSFPEIVGANLVSGFLMVVMGIFGVGGRIMRWVPLPIIMGMFAGSILGYVTRLVAATVENVGLAGVAVGCYLLGRLLGKPSVPPVGLAVIGGGIAVALVGTPTAEPVNWTLPVLAIPEMAFSFAAIIAVSLPMVVLSMGLGNVQGIGFLLAQGYAVPVNTVSTVVGVNSVVNALLGGHAATVARTSVAIIASPDSGPLSSRYWAAIISALLTVLLAFAASPVASLLNVLPKTYIFAIAGLAIISSLQDALEKALMGKMRFGALIAFAVAATPFAVLGITSAFWAIIVGLLASLLVEPKQILEFWVRNESSDTPLQIVTPSDS